MTTGRIQRDDASLAYSDVGDGLPVVFQHGLGGDDAQAAHVFPAGPGFRRITLECRGQGGSEFGPANRWSIQAFAEDVAALAGQLGVERPVVGGISMGAAIALRNAVHGPIAPRALILARPAWEFEAAPSNMQVYAEVGALMRDHDSATARRLFEAGASAATLRDKAPDNLASLVGFFEREDAEAFGRLLVAIAADGPGVSESDARAIVIPTLVIGHEQDLVHPLSSARLLAATIPGAELSVITPKAVDRAAYARDFQSTLASFLRRLQ